jgi:peptidyl-prolyl cis-trans isomerase A (cyclophilin A)
VAEELYATLKTNHGDIEVKLFPDHAPKTVRNFVELAEGSREWVDPRTGEKSTAPLYDGTVFHRVISGFMIQGGDPLGPAPAAPATASPTSSTRSCSSTGPTCSRWPTPARAPTGRSSSSPVDKTPHLNRKHTIFGEVANGDGRAVVDRIAGVRTGRMDRPVDDVVIESVAIERRQA